MKKQRKGFTLVELLIVIAILGVIAIYAIPKYQSLTFEAVLSEAKAQLGTVRSALNIYYARHEGHYPDTIDGSLFTDGQVPTVTIAKAIGSSFIPTAATLISSNAVVTIVRADGMVIPPDITDVGGWIYVVTPDRTKCDVRINSHLPDRITYKQCPPLGRPYYGY